MSILIFDVTLVSLKFQGASAGSTNQAVYRSAHFQETHFLSCFRKQFCFLMQACIILWLSIHLLLFQEKPNDRTITHSLMRYSHEELGQPLPVPSSVGHTEYGWQIHKTLTAATLCSLLPVQPYPHQLCCRCPAPQTSQGTLLREQLGSATTICHVLKEIFCALSLKMSNVHEQWKFPISGWNTDLQRDLHHFPLKEFFFLTDQKLFINSEPKQWNVNVFMQKSVWFLSVFI